MLFNFLQSLKSEASNIISVAPSAKITFSKFAQPKKT